MSEQERRSLQGEQILLNESCFVSKGLSSGDLVVKNTNKGIDSKGLSSGDLLVKNTNKGI